MVAWNETYLNPRSRPKPQDDPQVRTSWAGLEPFASSWERPDSIMECCKNQKAWMAGGSPEGREEGALPSARGEPATRLNKKLLLLGVAFMASSSRRKSRKFELAFEAIENLFGPLAAGLPPLTIPCGELAPQGTEEAQQIVGDRPELLALGWLLGTQAHGNPDLLGVATI